MNALVHHAGERGGLHLEDVEAPAPGPGDVLLRVRACGVCRTDLHIIDEELPPLHDRVIPGHQIVGEVVDSGERVGVSWLGGVDGTCWFCRHGMENLCDAPVFTGYSRDGGYAAFAVAREDFTFRYRKRLTMRRRRRYFAPESSVFAHCVWQASLRASASGFSVSALQRIWRCSFCGRGSARCTSRPAANRTGGSRGSWERSGLARQLKGRPAA